VPSLPLHVSVSTEGVPRSLTVQWTEPARPGSVITTYMIAYNEVTISVNGSVTMITLTALEPYSGYLVAVTACTADGCGNQTDYVVGLTEEEGI